MKLSGKILSVGAAVLMALSLGGCGAQEDVMAPVQLEIHDSAADIEEIGEGKARLEMEGIITNKSELKTVDYTSLPYLKMDDKEVTTTYEPVDSEDTDKVAPGKSVVYSVTYDFDTTAEHEWKFGSREDTVVSGLDEYVCIKRAMRAFEGKGQVTDEEIEKMEEEQQKKFEEFEKSQKEKNN
ncbi:MAG: hypothetical protein IJ583_04870 [Firmicutes bacterium]|nr:hypothetical protein [Bacillota bacterium]